MEILGIDIGGSFIKSGLVDVARGCLTAKPLQVPTPRPAKPEAFLDVFQAILEHFKRPTRVGIGFPGVVQGGCIRTAPNLDDGWKGLNLPEYIQKHCKSLAFVLNDADAAGLAEMTWGSGKGHIGTTVVLTLGTGIGSAFFNQGLLCPNFELGHLIMEGGKEAEQVASAKARVQESLSWKTWAQRLDDYLEYLHSLFWPDYFILGGGIASESDKFLPLLSLKNKIKIAKLLNNAGFMGAALGAYSQGPRTKLNC